MQCYHSWACLGGRLNYVFFMSFYRADQLCLDDRLADIVVHPHLIAVVDVVLVVEQGNHNDCHLRFVVRSSDVLDDVPAVYLGHHQVEQDDVGLEAIYQFDSFTSVRDNELYLKAL